MRLARRLYIKEFLKAFAIVVCGLSFILASVDLINALDNFKSKGFSSAAGYIIYIMPEYVVYTLPMAVLFAALFVVGQAVRSKETVAVMTAGGKMRALFLPIAAAGAVITMSSFVLSEFVVPVSTGHAKAMMTSSGGATFFREGTIWFRADDGSLVRFNIYDKDTKSASGVDIFQFGGGTITGRVEAKSARYKDGRWLLEGVRIYDLQKKSVYSSREAALSDIVKPSFLDSQVQRPEEMGITELYQYAQRLKKAGIRNIKLDVDMNERIAYPLVNFFMVLFAISLSLRRGLGGLAAASVGVAVSLAYWFSYTLSLSLGYAGMVPPIAAAWGVPAVFAALSLKLYAGIRD